MATPRQGFRLPRGAVVAVAVGAALLVAALAGGPPGQDGPPLDPRSDGPLGTSALVSLLDGLGADVSLSVGLPDEQDDVALVLQDRLDEDQAEQVTRWVAAGGRLVVTDPGSSFTPPVIPAGILPDAAEVEPGTCTVSALTEVGAVAAGSVVRYEVGEADSICFGSRQEGSFVVVRSLGNGEVAAVGGAAFVTNELLDDSDNAVLAAALLAPSPGTAVRVLEAPVPAGGGTKTLGDLVPGRVRRALTQLAVAFALYALWRAVRHGRPVPEDQPVEVAGSELVSAIGRLLSRTRSPGAAADTLRGQLRRALRIRYGVPADADDATLARLVATRSGADLDTVLAAVDDRPVTDDAELVTVARAVSSVHQEVLR
ncbi:MAG: DUF4350 domain-containing protein [Acidimicrobiales bacterium]